jgi:diaminopimelate epimerase
MNIVFNKYQGAGNDFIIIDNRKGIFDPSACEIINKMCDRRFGIGADGLILVSNYKGADFEMKYYNSDGRIASMCGNGGRCTAHFSHKWKIAGAKQQFMAFDGIHQAEVDNDTVHLQMGNVSDYKLIDGNYFINTGSPHYVVFTRDADSLKVYEEGKKLRWSPKFAPEGTNVNFVQIVDKGLYVRTFERGVEDETLACGTGVTASAIASVLAGHFDTNSVSVKTRGGNLRVDFEITDSKVSNIWLTGPATSVFEGTYEI